jgi:iron-sulfur cluster repair protein YtfE (RIC family)
MANEGIDLDEIIAIIAKKNKIIINERDPLLAIATVNDYVINYYFQKSNEALSVLTNELEKIHQSVTYEAKQNASQIINASLKKSTQLIEQNTQKSIDLLNEAIKGKISRSIAEEVEPLKNALRISNCMLLFSSILLVIAGVIIAIKV